MARYDKGAADAERGPFGYVFADDEDRIHTLIRPENQITRRSLSAEFFWHMRRRGLEVGSSLITITGGER